MKQMTCLKSCAKQSIAAFILTLMVVVPQVIAAEDIAGEWEMTTDFGGRTSFATLSFSKKADGTLTGMWSSNNLSDVKFDGEKLTFVRTIRFGDQEFTMNYTGTLKDGKLTGTMSSDRGDFAANGTRKKPKLPVVGQWDISFDAMDRNITARLIISEKPDGILAVAWTKEPGEHVVSNAKFQDGKLTFTRKSKIEDMEFETTYEGTVKGNELTGVLKGEMGDFPVKGQRFGATLIGKWELTVNSEMGTFPSMMVIEPDLTGRYEMFGEIPMKDLKLEGDQVTFYIEAGFRDQTFKSEFKGKLEGKTIKGQMVSEMGTSEITGKKVEPVSVPPIAVVTPTSTNIVGTWELTSESAQGTRTSTLKIKSDMTGTYTSRDTETPIKDLKVEADQVTFKVIRTFNDQEFTMDFKGKLDGATLKGEFTTPRGAREVTGKKTNPTP